MAEKLRAGVIGVGVMGQHHVRAYREIPDIEMVGFVDTDETLSAAIRQRHNVRGWQDVNEFLDHERPDLVTIAVPTVLHGDVARAAIERGIHVLIEKPIAETEAEGRALIDLAQAHNVVLAVGHIERHNPAITALKQRLSSGAMGRIFELRAERVGPFPPRIRDVGVVLDLATHDIDIICYLADEAPVRVFAETQQNVHSTREDMISGMLRFQNGIAGILHVNWLTPAKNRKLSATCEGGMIEVDYITQDLTYYENGELVDDFGALQILRGVSEGRIIREKIVKREPLRLELEDFIGAVRGEHPPRVTGEAGLLALRIAHALVESGKSHQVVEIEQA